MSAEQFRTWDNNHVWHPFAPMSAHIAEGVPIIASASGFFLTDTDGKQYLDGNSSLWCNVHGHRVPAIDEAVRNQLGQVAHTTLLGLTHPLAAELAAQLVARTPAGLEKVFYSDSGSTAVEAALKIAYQYHAQKPTGPEHRDLFVCVSNAYHGDTIGSVSVGGIDLFHSVYGQLLFKTIQVPSPVTFRVPTGHTPESYLEFCDTELERLLRENASRIAGFVIEPLVQGAAGILVHPNGYLKRVRTLTRELDIPLIADEVAVGFGRTGTLFACEQEDVVPDLLCLAKGITGGYIPLAATLATDEIYNAFLGDPADGRTFYHGHTYTGNPLACAAALASLRLFDDKQVLQNAAQASARLTTRLGELSGHPHVGEVRQKGMMVGIELVQDRDGNIPYPAADRTGHQVTLSAREHGTITRPLGDVVVLMPAPAMPVDLIDRLCDSIFTAIDDITRST